MAEGSSNKRDLSMNFSGKTVLLTGAGGVLGQSMARCFADNGARVVLNDLTGESIDPLARSLGDKALVCPGDISSESFVEELVASIVQQWGAIDILVNNAGRNEPPRGTARQTLSVWRQVIDVNLQGPFLLSRAVGKLMCDRREGAIVNIASATGLCGFAASNAYGVSKAALVMMTKTMGVEFARYGVRVNAVAPSLVEAPAASVLDSSVRKAFVRRTPMGRPAIPEEVAAAVAFLASDLASYIAGTTLSVDGGWAAFGGIGDAAHGL